MPLLPGHQANFDTLRQAFLSGDVALMECQLAAAGENVAVICAADRQDDGGIAFVPFAMFFDDNPLSACESAQSRWRVHRAEERTTKTWKCPDCGHTEEISYEWLAQHGTPVCGDCDCEMEIEPEDVAISQQ